MDHADAQNLANLKIVAIHALYPESFCDKNLAFRKVFAFCDSEYHMFHSIFGCFSAKISYQKNTNILGIPDPPPLLKDLS